HRFGLGPKSGSITALASDPRGALMAELERPGAGLIVNANLPTATQASRTAFNFRQEQQAKKIALELDKKDRGETAGTAMEAKADQANANDANANGGAKKPPEPNIIQRNFRAEAIARFAAANTAEIGFVERLVWFWSNHFCVATDVVLSLAGGYEREAIRP